MIDAQVRKSNLRFFNINDDKQKSAKDIIDHFIDYDLKCNVKTVAAYRVVTRAASQRVTTHILARFQNLDEAAQVKSAAYKKPKGTSGSVEEDLPFEWAQTRKMAYTKYVKPAKIMGEKVRWVGDKLYINNVHVTIKKEEQIDQFDSESDEEPTRGKNSTKSTR